MYGKDYLLMAGNETRKRKKFFRQSDLTEGTIWKSILFFSLPILLSYFLQTLYSIADAAICGHTLSANEVSGVGDTGSITFIFLQFAFGCTAGMSVIIANHAGKKDAENMRKAFATQILLSIFIIVILTAISLLTLKPLLRLLGIAPTGNTVNDEVFNAAYTYLFIICGGMAGQFFYNVICCVLRSIGDSKTPLVFLAISTVLNISLDLLFIMVCHWGVAGAAAATVISQSFSAVACFIYTVVHYKELRPRASDFKAFNFRTALRTLWQGVPLGLQFSVLAFGLITMQNGVISFDKLPSGEMVAGTPAQIGYGAACKMDGIFMTPLNALGTAMISYTAQNYGAGKRDRIRRGALQCFFMMLIISAFSLVVEMLMSINGAYQYIYLARDKISADTIRYGNTYLYSVVPFLIILGILYLERNVVQGLEKPLFPFLAGLGELAGRILVCMFLPALINGAPIDANASSIAFFGLGLGDAAAWLFADLILLYPLIKYVMKKQPEELAENSPAEEPAPNAPQEAEAAVTKSEPETDENVIAKTAEQPPEPDVINMN